MSNILFRNFFLKKILNKMYYALFGVYRCKSRLTRLLLKGLVL